MPRKKAKSNLPGELNENFGSNYMMDGFWHDMEYGHGPASNPASQPIPQPSSSGMAQLPDGVIAEDSQGFAVPDTVEREEEGLQLGELEIVAADRTDTGITDFTWLGDASQDPKRLPSSSRDVIPELQEAWGNRTDGIQRIDLVDRDAFRYEDAFQGEEDDDPTQRDKLAFLVRSAMRRSASGDVSFARKHLKDPKLQKSMGAVVAEHGLHGRVYLRASAYPKLHQGKYAKEFKKAARGCRYLIAENTPFTREAASTLGLRLLSSVAKINWKKAYQSYASQLVKTGRLKSAAVPKDPMRKLQRAFLAEERAPHTHIETVKPVPVLPVDRVSSKQAWETLANYRPEQREILSWVAREKRAAKQALKKKLANWVTGNLLSQEDARRLLASEAPPQEILKAASAIVTATKKGEYQGWGRGREFHVFQQSSSVSKQAWEQSLAKKAQAALLKDRQNLVAQVTKLVTAGVLNQGQANKLLDQGVDSRTALRFVSKFASESPKSTYNQGNARHHLAAPASAEPTRESVARHVVMAKKAQQAHLDRTLRVEQEVQRKQAQRESLLIRVGKIAQLVEKGASKAKLAKAVKANFSRDEVQQVREHLEPILVKGGFYDKKVENQYQGPVQTLAPTQKHEASVSPQEVRKVARWVRQQMSEGVAGQQLDQLIQIRLTPTIKRASEKKISALRAKHEGLSGHLYVDAGAYGTKNGTKGCEEGALRHRANQLKFVLAQKQCNGCVFKNADSVCQKYNKLVVEKLPQENLEGYRQQILASHVKNDQEMTADLFNIPSMKAATNPVSEFGLHNANLDDIETEESPVLESIDGIFFGGFEV